MMVESLEADLLAPLNRALGEETVRRVYVIPGSEAVVGEIAARLPSNRIIGCGQRRSSRV